MELTDLNMENHEVLIRPYDARWQVVITQYEPDKTFVGLNGDMKTAIREVLENFKNNVEGEPHR